MSRLRSEPPHFNSIILWVALSVCFLFFFWSGDFTVPTATAYDARVHLSWGDVSIDAATPPTVVRVFLKRSKTDQFGRGTETGNELCPVVATVGFSHTKRKQGMAILQV